MLAHSSALRSWVLLLSLLVNSTLLAKEPKDESFKLFDSGQVLRLKIEIPPEEVSRIQAEGRPYVRGVLIENDETTFKSVGFKLKGAAGSFREFNDRPALTLNVDKFKKKQSFHGLDKFHLNNSVQDESYLSEWICSEIFRSAGCPTPRVAHARVWLNGRDVGLYVLKEGFDSNFLKRNFAKSNGNLYDGGFLQDIDANLEKDEGAGPDDHSDLHALAEAAHEPDPRKRWARVAELVDLDAFINFMVLERMTCHWDGYSLNMNNYRIYFDPGRGGRAVFLPHGMDQMFGDPGMNLFDLPHPLISSVVLQNSEGWRKYRQRIHSLLPTFAPPDKWLKRLDEAAARLKPVLAEISEDAAQAHADRVRELKERIAQRAENLKEQDQQPDPEFQPFDAKGIALLTDWYPVSESEDAKLEEVELPNQRKGYSIKAGPSGQCVASWRRRVLLGPGTYILEARCRTNGVIPLEDNEASAAGVRISRAERNVKLLGTQTWTPQTFEFSVRDDRRDVELVLELKAKRGDVTFATDSLRLIRKPR